MCTRTAPQTGKSIRSIDGGPTSIVLVTTEGILYQLQLSQATCEAGQTCSGVNGFVRLGSSDADGEHVYTEVRSFLSRHALWASESPACHNRSAGIRGQDVHPCRRRGRQRLGCAQPGTRSDVSGVTAAPMAMTTCL